MTLILKTLVTLTEAAAAAALVTMKLKNYTCLYNNKPL
jgi:hypothetical protein